MPKPFYLIDGHSYAYQAYYAIRALNAPDGQPVNAVYGFTNLILRILTKEKPAYLAVTFDTKEKTFRSEQYADYKAQRKPMPDDLVSQMPILDEVLAALNVPTLRLPRYEADDLIGTLARLASAEKIDTYIISKDKDLKQLLGPHVRLYDVVKGIAYDTSSMEQELSLRPEQMIDYLGLMGDASDNIPGVPGVGPKTAQQLLAEYGSLEAVLENAEAITKKKLRENLLEFADQARLSKQLATIDTAVPLSVGLDDLKRPELAAAEAAGPIFRRLGFRKFAEMVATQAGPDAKPEPEAAPDLPTDYRLVNDEKGLKALISKLSKQTLLSVDLETTSTSELLATIVGLSFSFAPGQAWYVAIRGPLGAKTLEPAATLAALKPLLENADIRKVGQNIKYDALVLRNAGITLSPLYFDTMIASYLLQPESRRHGLDVLSMAELNHPMIPISDLIGKGKKQTTMDTVPLEQASTYACEDADIAFRIYQRYTQRLEEEGLAELFHTVEMPLVDLLVAMEFRGIRLDTDLLETMHQQLDSQITRLEKAIHERAGEPFNIGSPKQLAVLLYETLDFAPGRKSKTGYSTNADELERLQYEYDDELPGMLLEYRKLTKLKSTYVDALPTLINPKTGRIHTSFNQAVAATGRLSSSDPNLQNIPVRTELGRKIRAAFTASDADHTLVTADYSQIELRILAHLSGDPALVAAFEADRDIHTEVACRIFGIEPEAVEKEQRILAKAVNFGILYGQSPFGLSRELKIPQAEAKAFIDRYFCTYAGVKTFIDAVIERCREDGFVTTLLNRRRAIPEINSDRKQAREFAERTAVNTVVQGSAADLIKVAMNDVWAYIQSSGSSSDILLQIHDELLFEVRRDEVVREAAQFESLMVGAMELSVPLKVSVAVGDNWLEVESGRLA